MKIKRTFKKTACAALSAVMIVTTVFATAPKVSAADATVKGYEEQIAGYEKTQQELQAKIAANKNEASKAAENKAYLDQLIYTIEAKMTASESLIAELNASAETAKAEIAECEAEMEVCSEKFADRMRMMQDGSGVSYLDMLFGAESLGDFLSRIEHINAMMEYDEKISEEYGLLKAELEQKKADLEASAKLQADTLASLEADKAEAERLAKDAEAYIDQLEADAKQYQSEYEKAAAAEAELDAKLTAYLKSLEDQKSSQVVADGEYAWPLPTGKGYITCKFGGSDPNNNPHYALDIAIAAGTSIYAANDGTVLVAGYHDSYGYYILVDHGNGMASLYAHCSALLVTSGQTVSRGQTIGRVGTTGFSEGNHLHFEIRKNGKRTDPLNYMAPQAPEYIL